jgi:hypothetical protein
MSGQVYSRPPLFPERWLRGENRTSWKAVEGCAQRRMNAGPVPYPMSIAVSAEACDLSRQTHLSSWNALSARSARNKSPGVGAGSYAPQHRVPRPRAASKKTPPLRGRGVPRERRGQVWEGCLPLTGGRCVGGLLEHGRNGLPPTVPCNDIFQQRGARWLVLRAKTIRLIRPIPSHFRSKTGLVA